MKHKHRFRIDSYNHKTIWMSCRCGERKERPPYPAELRQMNHDEARHARESKEMHTPFWDFKKTFLKEGYHWRWSGYPLMTRIRKWANRYPKRVSILGIDDDAHASSNLVCITHRVGKRLWGVTFVTVTQCDGQKPVIFFMYPEHLKAAAKFLSQVNRLPLLFKS